MNIEKHTHGQRLGIPNLYFQERVLSLTYPGGPFKVLHAKAGLLELVDVGDPLEAVAGDEHGDDVEADLRQFDLLGSLVHSALGNALRQFLFLKLSQNLIVLIFEYFE